MTKADKLYQQLLSSTSRTISFRDFERLLEALGWELKRTKGSHRHYAHPGVAMILTINPDGKNAHRYQVRLLLELVEEYGLHMRP
jgi:predicted RNA binding protein YcfA (HicA-like mRNA interferase family)